MAFTSLNFLVFFPVVAFLYWVSPPKIRWFLLLVASYFFYLNTKPVFVVLIAGVTLSTWVFTNLIDKTPNQELKKKYMIGSIVLILLPLFFFKYFGSINHSIISAMEAAHLRWPLPEIQLLLPIGISYYTFMAIGYIIDVYNEEIEAEKNIGIVALFVSFFPLVLSGPIERATNMIPQFKTRKEFNYHATVEGLKLILWGYFMKLVVADRLGIYVDAVFNNVEQHTGTTLFVASLMYSIQVYGDLGGYSLIAIGVAKILGIGVMQNFNRPFFAPSMSEFWRRWHISLIKWLTDYVYTPLSFAFRRYKKWGIVLALLITFMLSGIWHGAAFAFVIWGLVQGILLSIEALTKIPRDNFEKRYRLRSKMWYILLSSGITFLLFSFSLVISKSTESSTQAFYVFGKIFSDLQHLPYKDGTTMLYGFIAVSILFIKEFIEEFYPNRILLFQNKRTAIRWIAYYGVIAIIFYMGVFGGGQFIYYQF